MRPDNTKKMSAAEIGDRFDLVVSKNDNDGISLSTKSVFEASNTIFKIGDCIVG